MKLIKISQKSVRYSSFVEPPPVTLQLIMQKIVAVYKLLEVKGKVYQEMSMIKTLEQNNAIFKEVDREYRMQRIKDCENNVENLKKEFENFGTSFEDFGINSSIKTTVPLDFSGWKYIDLLKDVKLKNESLFNSVIQEMSIIKLSISIGKNKMFKGTWNENKNEINIILGREYDSEYSTSDEYYQRERAEMFSSLEITISHELVHLSQTMFKRLGIDFGNPSKKISDPSIRYHFPNESEESSHQKYQDVISKLDELGLDSSFIAIHTMSDIETFNVKSKNLNEKEKLELFKLWTGIKNTYCFEIYSKKTSSEFKDIFSEEILNYCRRCKDCEVSLSNMHILKKNNPKKWQKSVKEFYKAVFN